jgi:cytochrome c oxidase subunit 2
MSLYLLMKNIFAEIANISSFIYNGLFTNVLRNNVSCDAGESWQLGFQDPATPIMEGIINFHNDLMVIIVVIMVFTTWILVRCWTFFIRKSGFDSRPVHSQKITHNTFIEIVWTVIPIAILMIIAVPSFSLLYAMEELIEPTINVKVMGHQWYWSYSYGECADQVISELVRDKNFESYMLPTDDLDKGNLRLLEVDNRLYLPTKTHIRFSVSASDVLHCWAVPSLGVKVDACPGRLNQISIFIKREGTFYGQCSEICGINHGFMPIVVEALSLKDFIKEMYLQKFLAE